MARKKIKPAPDAVESEPRKYKPGERAAMVRRLKDRFPEMSAYRIAKRVGCSENSARSALRTYLGKSSQADLELYQANKADAWDAIGMRSLGFITDKKLIKTSAQALGLLAAVSVDKAQLLRGQATSINVVALMDVAQMIRQRDE